MTALLLAVLATIPPESAELPNRQPQLAASGNTVTLVYGSGKSILFAKSADQGATFSRAVRIAELPVLPLSRHRGPRVAFSGKTLLVTAIGGKTLAAGPHAHGLPADGDLYVWRSTDGGVTWSAPAVINDEPGSAREGLHALAAGEHGEVAAAWLDLRSPGTRLYGAVSRDGGASWSANIGLYKSPEGTICQCCHPSLLALPAGGFAVMFRNVLEGRRDMYWLRVRDSQVVAAPRKLGAGTWRINACPMDGGGLAVSDGRPITAWRREGEVFLAVPGEAEVRLGRGKDVALAAARGKIFAVWTDDGAIRYWTSGRTGVLAPAGAFPSVTALPAGGALVAWEDHGSIQLAPLR